MKTYVQRIDDEDGFISYEVIGEVFGKEDILCTIHERDTRAARELANLVATAWDMARERDAFANQAVDLMAKYDVLRREYEALTKWHQIDTAPKDFTDVLLYVPSEDDGTGSEGVVKGWYSMEDGGFDCWRTYDVGPRTVHPTHWQPLPKPPSSPIPTTTGKAQTP